MRNRVLLLYSLLIICNKISFSIDDKDELGVVFFTNFNYFKSNEKKFKNLEETENKILSNNSNNSLNPPSIQKPIIPTIPDIKPGQVTNPTVKPDKPDKPEIKPDKPDKPSDSFTEIFYNNNWIYNKYSYETSENLIVSVGNNLLTGMGAIQSGFSIQNDMDVNIEGKNSTSDLIGMLSLNGGKIINGKSGVISVNGGGNSFGMVVLGQGSGENNGSIFVNSGAIGMYTESGNISNFNKITVNEGAAMLSTESGLIKNAGTIETSTSTKVPGFGITTFKTSRGENIGEIVVNKSQIGMLGFDSSQLNSSGVLKVNGGIGAYVNDNSQMKNSGTINISNAGTGIYVYGNGGNGAAGYNNKNGIIEVENSSIGMSATNNGLITNNGTIKMSASNVKTTTQGVGMYITNNGIAQNNGDIILEKNQVGIYSEGAGSSRNSGNILVNSQGTGVILNNSTFDKTTFLNENTGVIKGDAVTGVLLGGAGYVQNYGEINIVNGTAGTIANGSGAIYNFNNITIANTKYGMLSLNGGGIVNENITGYTSSINSDNNEIAKMAVIGSGYALNEGKLSSGNVPYIMYLSGTGNMRNTGTLTLNLTDNFSTHTAMYGEKGGLITNDSEGIINVNGGSGNYGMMISGAGKLVNDGVINAGDYQNGVLISGSAVGINNGKINFGINGTGVSLYNMTSDGYFQNNGEIIGQFSNFQGGAYGIYAFGDGEIYNKNLIKMSYGNAGICISGNGTAINEEEGKIIIYDTNYAMYATNGATIRNYGTIEVTPIYDSYSIGNSAMYVDGSGTAINSNDIIVGGAYFNAMGTSGNALIKNEKDGVITILDGAIQSFAFDLSGGAATNAGVINLGTTGELVNNGTLFNYGYINAPNGIKNGENGNLVMEQGGTTNSDLKEATLGLSYAPNIYDRNDKNFGVLNLTFNTDKVYSYSYLYDIDKENDNFLIRRKDFTEVTEKSLGNFLEDIYLDDGNSVKNNFFNILRSAQTKAQYNSYLDSFFGRDLYPNVIFQTKDTIEYTIDNILDNTEEKLPNNKKSSLIVGYTFEKFRQKGFDNVKGYDDNLNGFYLGKQYYLNSVNDYGFVFSYTRLDSDYYSNLGKREDNFLQGTAFMNYNQNNITGIGALYLGFAKGNIKRNFNLTYLDYENSTPKYANISNRYKGDTKTFYVGTSGKISKRYNVASLFIEPEMSTYLMGIFQDEINESGKEFNLHINELNRFFGKIKSEVGVGKEIPIKDYQLTIKLIGGIGQEINSSNDDLKVSLRNVSDEKGNIKVNKDNQFSKEIGTKIDIKKIGIDNLDFYIDYRYIFENNDSWRVRSGVVYKF